MLRETKNKLLMTFGLVAILSADSLSGDRPPTDTPSVHSHPKPRSRVLQKLEELESRIEEQEQSLQKRQKELSDSIAALGKEVKDQPIEFTPEVLKVNTWDRLEHILLLTSVLGLVFGSGATLYNYIRQRKDRKILDDKINEITDKSDKLGRLLEVYQKKADAFTDVSQSILFKAERDLRKFYNETQIEIAQTQVNRAKSDLDRGVSRVERIGDFSDMFFYLARRVQTANKQVIIRMPFALYGFLGNPMAHNELHLTLREKFAEVGGDGCQCVIIAPPEEDRVNHIKSRYDHSIDALKILHDYAMIDEMSDMICPPEKITDPEMGAYAEVRRNFRSASIDFNDQLTSGDRKRIYILSREYAAAKDKRSFTSGLSDLILNAPNKSDKVLFGRIVEMRAALAVMLENLESFAFDEFRKVSAILVEEVRSPNKAAKFNEMLVSLDGREIVRCTTKVASRTARENAVWSFMGQHYISGYTDRLVDLLKESQSSGAEGIVNELNGLLEKYADFDRE